ncbi:MAG: hypothetical protein LQ352_001564 [Teloschistes flavicans]|nr:MAG: hypothetical protein LQ352_001564 [Teloschistes flavicans]
MELPLSIILIIRVIQLLLAIILIGLTACSTFSLFPFLSSKDPETNNKSVPPVVHKLYLNTTNFLLFASIWTVFPALTYEALELRYPQYQRVLNPSNSKGFNFVTAVFWFGGFIALAVFYRDLDYCFGKVCGVMVATIILAAFEW